MELSVYTIDSLWLAVILFFAVRITFKKRGGLGLVIPTMIVLYASSELFILSVGYNVLIGIMIVVISLWVRQLQLMDNDINNVEYDVIVNDIRISRTL